MVSNIIVNMLSNAGLGLIKGVNLFAERSIGDTYVIVSSTAQNGDAYIPELKYGPINIIVSGWDIKSGFDLAHKIANLVLSMEGGTYTYDNGISTETYDLLSVSVRNWPSLIPNLSIVSFTINIDLSYKQTN